MPAAWWQDDRWFACFNVSCVTLCVTTVQWEFVLGCNCICSAIQLQLTILVVSSRNVTDLDSSSFDEPIGRTSIAQINEAPNYQSGHYLRESLAITNTVEQTGPGETNKLVINRRNQA
jgi:hypothetical protein